MSNRNRTVIPEREKDSELMNTEGVILENPMKIQEENQAIVAAKIQYSNVDSTSTKKSPWKRQKKIVEEWINNTGPQVFLLTLLMLSLFMADAWVLGNAPDSSNDILSGILMFVFAVFVIETVVLALVQEGYMWSLFFWMDVVGTLSILLDIGWVTDPFIPSGSVDGRSSVLRATKAAKLGARYGRLMRMLKFLKFLKDIPCLKFLRDSDDYEPTMGTIKKVSEELSAILSLRVAALVMLLVIVMPFLSYEVTDYSEAAWLLNFRVMAKNENVTADDISYSARRCEKFYYNKNTDLVKLTVESPWLPPPYYSENLETRNPLRQGNVVEYTSQFRLTAKTLLDSKNSYANAAAGNATGDEYVQFNVDMSVDQTAANQEDALYSIIVIVLVIVILFTFTGSFNSAVNRLVVQPLEKMLRTLRNSAMLMLQSLEGLAKEKQKEEDGDNDEEDTDEDEEMETAMLEKMVEKLAKIVKHVLPGNNEIAVDENVDKDTANWLNEAYSTGTATSKREKEKNENQSMMLFQPQPSATEEEATVALLDKENEDLMQSVSKIVPMEVLNSWQFNALEFSAAELTGIMTYQFMLLGLLKEFKVPIGTFQAFLSDIAARYIESNTYHNYTHGVDVCHTTYRLLMLTQLDTVLSSLEMFSLLVGAIAHDVGHPGINNIYLVKSKHDLALQHNDRSPLENMHCVVLYEVLRQSETAIFSTLTEYQWREARRVILTVILGTDMQHHFEQISKTQLFVDINGDETKAFYNGETQELACLKDDKNRLFIMELVLHCSDISNPYKPFKICAKWADLVVEEFWRQGDREREEGLEISNMCDRNDGGKKGYLCNMQLGFIEFVVAPLINAFISAFPPLTEIGDTMLDNVQCWGERRKGEIRIDESFSTAEQEAEMKKVDERFEKFKDKMSFMEELKKKKKIEGAPTSSRKSALGKELSRKSIYR